MRSLSEEISLFVVSRSISFFTSPMAISELSGIEDGSVAVSTCLEKSGIVCTRQKINNDGTNVSVDKLTVTESAFE